MREERVTTPLKKLVASWANGNCEYCRSQSRFAMQPFSVEHIIPRSRGGKTTADNLALSCQGCNNCKYNKTKAIDPVSGELAALYHPRQEQWEEHFIWNDDFSIIIGITPTGRGVAIESRKSC